MNYRNLKNSLTVGGAIVLAALIASSFISYRNLLQTAESRRWVIHTYEVINTVDVLTAQLYHLEEYESFATSDMSSIYSAFNDIANEAQANSQKLADLVHDNQLQTTTVRDLKVVMARLGTQSRSKNLPEAISSAKQALKLMPVLKKREQELLAERSQRLHDTFNRVRWIFVALLSVMITTVLVSLLLVLRFVREIDQANQHKDKQAQLLAMQFNVSKLLNDERDAKIALQELLKLGCHQMQWQTGALWRPDPSNSYLICTDYHCVPELEQSEFTQQTRTLKYEADIGLPGKIWKSWEPLWVQNTGGVAEYPRAAAATKAGLLGAFGFPLVSDGKFFGVMEFFSRHYQQPDSEWLTTFSLTGSEVAHFLLRKETEHELELAEKRFRKVVESSSHGVIMLQEDGRIVLVNKQIEDMFGYRREELIDQHLELLVPTHAADTQRTLEDKQDALNLSWVGTRKDGSQFPLEAGVTTLTDEGKRYLLANLVDVTVRKEAEKRVSEFYSSVSHELRTPLTSIRGALGLLGGGKVGELSPKADHLVQIARDESDRLIRLINDILDIRKIEAGKFDLSLGDYDPSELVTRTKNALDSFAASSEVTIEAHCQTSRKVRCDADRFVQVLTNLVSNAIKFSEPHSTVTIAITDGRPGYVKIAVSDSGPGIPSDKMNKLFGLFQQLDSSDARSKGGTGLGLAICKAIVELHDGHVGVESEVGKGSTFWFDMPAARHLYTRTGYLGGASHVLVVEDDLALGEMLSTTLADNGYSVVHATNLKEARTALEAHPSVIILDLKLPDGSGLELLPEVKRNPNGSEPQVVVITGHSPDGSTMGYPVVVDWLCKPFEMDAIRKLVTKIFKSDSHKRATVLVIEDDQAARDILSTQLANFDLNCITATDGASALRLVDEHDIDFIIMDVRLPDITGFDVVDVLKKHKKYGNTPLVVYTITDLSQDEMKALKLGITKHLTKSRTTAEEFLAAITEILQGIAKTPDTDGTRS